MRLTLALPGGERIPFQAGQYINILLDDGQRRAFSFANPPQVQDHIELHVRRIPGGRFTGHVFTQMKVGDTLRFEGPLGDFTPARERRARSCSSPARPASRRSRASSRTPSRAASRGRCGCTGACASAPTSTRSTLAEQWQREHAQLPLRAGAVRARSGRRLERPHRPGPRGDAGATSPTCSGHEVYVCGSVKMVEAAVPAFLAQGLGEGFCFTDAFVPSASVVA